MKPNTEILQNHLKTIAPRAGEFVSTFYNRLYTHYPEIRPLFKDNNRSDLFHSLEFIVDHLSQHDLLLDHLQDLVGRHPSEEIAPEDWPKVGYALLDTLADFADDQWAFELSQTWVEACRAVEAIILRNTLDARIARAG